MLVDGGSIHGTFRESPDAQRDLPGGAPATVMLVDERVLMTDALKQLLESSGRFEVIAVARTADEAVRFAKGHSPDLAVIGPLSKSPTGWHERIELIGAIRGASDSTNVMVLTETRESRVLTEALDSGALGILEMSASSEELIAAAERLIAGEAHLPAGVALELVLKGRTEESEPLTEKEEDLVSEVALGYTNSEIADHMHLSVRTVETHRARIASRLGASNRAALVRYALDHGLIR